MHIKKELTPSCSEVRSSSRDSSQRGHVLSPKLKMLNTVWSIGISRRSIDKVRFAVSIREPPMLPDLSIRKIYSCDEMRGTLNDGTSVSCMAIVPLSAISAKHLGLSSPSACTMITKSPRRKVEDCKDADIRRWDLRPSRILYRNNEISG